MHDPSEMVDGDGRRLGRPAKRDASGGSSSQYVQNAKDKAARGEKLTDNEARRLERLGANLPPLRTGYVPAGADVADRSRDLQQGRDNIKPLEPIADAAGYSEGAAVSVPGTTGALKNVVAHSSGHPATSYPTELSTVAAGVTVKANADGLTITHADYLLQWAAVGGNLILQKVSNGKEVRIDLNGIADNVSIDANGIKITNTSSGDYALIGNDGKVTVHNAGNAKAVTIDPASLANNITIDANGIKVLNTSSSNYAKISEAGVITVYDASGNKTLTIDPELVTQNMSIREIDVCDAGVAKKMLVLASATY